MGKNNRLFFFIGALIAGSIGITSLLLYISENKNDQNTQETPHKTLRIATPATPMNQLQWKVFTSEQQGLSFKYPNTMQVMTYPQENGNLGTWALRHQNEQKPLVIISITTFSKSFAEEKYPGIKFSELQNTNYRTWTGVQGDFQLSVIDLKNTYYAWISAKQSLLPVNWKTESILETIGTSIEVKNAQ